MTEKKTNSGVYPEDSNDAVQRRETVKRLLGGAGIATAVTMWSKPIVESVVLPAHAQTSPAPPTRTTPPPPDDLTPPTSFNPPPTSDYFSPPPTSYYYYDPRQYYEGGYDDYYYISPPSPIDDSNSIPEDGSDLYIDTYSINALPSPP